MCDDVEGRVGRIAWHAILENEGPPRGKDTTAYEGFF